MFSCSSNENIMCLYAASIFTHETMITMFFNANMGNYQWFWCLFDDLSASLCPFYAFLCHLPHMMMSIPPSCWLVHSSRISMPINVFKCVIVHDFSATLLEACALIKPAMTDDWAAEDKINVQKRNYLPKYLCFVDNGSCRLGFQDLHASLLLRVVSCYLCTITVLFCLPWCFSVLNLNTLSFRILFLFAMSVYWYTPWPSASSAEKVCLSILKVRD